MFSVDLALFGLILTTFLVVRQYVVRPRGTRQHAARGVSTFVAFLVALVAAEYVFRTNALHLKLNWYHLIPHLAIALNTARIFLGAVYYGLRGYSLSSADRAQDAEPYLAKHRLLVRSLKYWWFITIGSGTLLIIFSSPN